MSNATNSNHDAQRLFELLAAESIGDLSAHEAVELDALRMRVPPVANQRGEPIADGQAERALGAVLAASAVGDAARPLSPALRAAIIAKGEAAVGGAIRSQGSARPRGARPWIGPVGWAGWAAAVVATSFFLWQVSTNQPPAVADRLADLLEEGAVRIALAPETDPAGSSIGGEVIWSASGQNGFLHLHGLAANDPAKEQYQLWVVDAGRGAAGHPVDCGVFDATSGFTVDGERYIPVQAKLFVTQPSRFVITLEPVGGVVISSLRHLVASAAVPPHLLKPAGPGSSDSHWPPR